MPITILDLVLLAVMLISGLLAMVRGVMREQAGDQHHGEQDEIEYRYRHRLVRSARKFETANRRVGAALGDGDMAHPARPEICHAPPRAGCIEHDPEKWKPVFRKDHAQTKRYR